jgi:hypothetical protein
MNSEGFTIFQSIFTSSNLEMSEIKYTFDNIRQNFLFTICFQSYLIESVVILVDCKGLLIVDTDYTCLAKKIENQRIKLNEIVDRCGLNMSNPEIIKASQELDEYIILLQKLKMNGKVTDLT